MPRHWFGGFALILALVAGVGGITLLLRPWPIKDAGLRAEIIGRLSAASGLAVTEAGAVSLHLAPRPRLTIAGLAMTGLHGAVAVDAEAFEGRLDLPDLFGGVLHVFAATLDRPTIVIHVDQVTPLVAAMVASPAATGSPAPAAFDAFRSEGLTLRSGVLRLMSGNPRGDTLLSDLSGTLVWPGNRGTATMTGTATWRGIAMRFDAALDEPADLMTPTGATTFIRLQSPAIDFSYDGTLASGAPIRGKGRLSATTRDLPTFLRAIGTPAPQLGAFLTAGVSGQASIAADLLSLSDVSLALGTMAFDGALTVHAKAGRPGLAGTLATDRIDLDPFLRALPAFQQSEGVWSRAALSTQTVADDDIDLRISASHATVDGLIFEDGSLSLQSGAGRMELSLGEARFYDGLLKGRVVATTDHEGSAPDTTDFRAELSVSRFDLKKLTKGVLKAGALGGTATGHLSLGGRGRTPADLVADLEGRGQVSVRNGAVSPQAAAWISIAPLTPPPDAAWPSDATRFESASADFEVRHGQAVLTDGWILWPDARAVVTGSASAPRQDLDLRAKLGDINDDGGGPAAAASVDLAGPWRHLRLSPLERDRPDR